jgi:TRAP-type C4-dicarboxylate transport system permease large subunit
MDTQFLLVLIIGLLSINLLFVGVYIVFVLKEVRESLRKFNEILETANQLTKSLAAPVITAAGTIEAAIQGFKAAQVLKARKSNPVKTVTQ